MYRKFKEKYIGDAAFYKKVLMIVVPMIIQNLVTNFVSLLDNIMVGQVGTEQMSGVAIVNQLMFVYYIAIFGQYRGLVFLEHSSMEREIIKDSGTHSDLKCMPA